jgi:poly-gamma-glutamate synthesis protein (capsule biosynthesis protein)
MPSRLWALVASVAVVGCGGPLEELPAEEGLPASVEPGFVDEEAITRDELEADRATSALRFRRACEAGERVTIAAVGDILLHPELQRQAYAEGWSSLWGRTTKWLDDAEVTYGNHEGPAARGVRVDGRLVTDPGMRFDDSVYTGFPKFNYHDSLERALRDASFDVVSIANNHSLDRGAVGLNRTLDAMDRAGLRHTGAIRSGSDDPWSARVVRDGFDLRFLACTYSTNGIADTRGQVLHCFKNRDKLLALVRSLSRRSDVDAVIVTPHWGAEFSDVPRTQEMRLAHELLDAGAVAVLGAHPHVTQPWEKYRTKDGRETFIIYSLGNFVSRHLQLTLARRSSLLLYLGLTRGPDGKAFVNGVAYMPLYMAYRNGDWEVVAIDEVGGYSDSRARTVGMYGPWNVRKPGAPLTTTPECR